MLITSKFRDFYDNCAAYGVDTQVRYDREPKSFQYYKYSEDKKVQLAPDSRCAAVLSTCTGWGPDMQLARQGRDNGPEVVVLGFCGKLYKCVLQIIWTYKIGAPRSYEHILHMTSETMPEDWGMKFHNWKSNKYLVDEFKTPLEKEDVDIFTLLNTPVFVAYHHRVDLNPNLRELGFQKFKDGVTAFQEISAFISGTLNTANQMQHTASDQELIQAHGFDKHSFRKGKTK